MLECHKTVWPKALREARHSESDTSDTDSTASKGTKAKRAETPCWYQARGRCTKGDNCRYKHESTSGGSVGAVLRTGAPIVVALVAASI